MPSEQDPVDKWDCAIAYHRKRWNTDSRVQQARRWSETMREMTDRAEEWIKAGLGTREELMPQVLENEATNFMRHLKVPKGRQIRLRSTEISSTALLVTEIHPGDVAEETIPELQRRRQVILWSHGSALKSISCVQEEIDEAKVYLQEERRRYDRLKVRQGRRAEKDAARKTALRAEQGVQGTLGIDDLQTDQTTASKRSGRPSGNANTLAGHKPRILPGKPSDYSASVTRSPDGTQASGRTGHSRIDLNSQWGNQSAFAD